MGSDLFGFLMGGEGFYFIFFSTAPEACETLVPWPGIKLAPPALEAWNLKSWTSREVPGEVLNTCLEGELRATNLITSLRYVTHFNHGPWLTVVRLNFSTLWWYKSNKHPVKIAFRFLILISPRASNLPTILSHDAGQWQWAIQAWR